MTLSARSRLFMALAAATLVACKADRPTPEHTEGRVAAPLRVSAGLLRAALDSLPPAPVAGDSAHGNPAAGRSLYAVYCVECHGMAGRGDGRLAAGFHPRPADLHQVQIAGREDSVMTLIRAGGPAHRTMPDWGAVFTDRRVRDLTAYLKVLQQH